MNVRYECLQVLRLRGNSSTGDIQSRTEITSGNTPVEWYPSYSRSNIACLKFIPTKNSDNLSVAFTINISFAQNKTGEFWCCGLYEDEPTTTRIASAGTGLYFKFGLNGSTYGDKDKNFTFTGDFKAGQTYWLVVGMASFSADNAASLIQPNNIVLTAEVTSGVTTYIWTTKDSESEEIAQTIDAGNTWRSLQSWDNGAWKKASSAGIGNTTIVGIGQESGQGSSLYYNATCIPIQPILKRAKSITITFPILYNGTGTHLYRWAVSTTDRSEAYINTLSEVNEAGQIASGVFSDYSGSTNTYTFNVDIPANTPVYLYLWSHGTSDGQKRYGNFHMKNTIDIILKTMSESGFGWVAYTAYVYTNGNWQIMPPKLYSNNSWEES